MLIITTSIIYCYISQIDIVTAASPAVISSAIVVPLSVIETKSFFKLLSDASKIRTWSALAADT